MLVAALMAFGFVDCGVGGGMAVLMVSEGLTSAMEIVDKVFDIDIVRALMP